jgi:hypothetical protein
MHRFLKIVPRTARAGRFPPNRVAALAFLAVMAIAAACGGNAEPARSAPTTAESAAASSTSPSAAATPTQSGPQILPSGDLEPGTYTTGAFKPRTTFRVGPNWVVQGELPGGLALAPKSVADTLRSVSITTVKWIIDKPLITDGELRNLREQHVKPAPRDLVGWLRANPYLRLTAPKPVHLAGLRGVQFDLTVRNVPPGITTCAEFAPKRCVTLFALTHGEGFELAELEGVPSRYTLLDLKGQPVLVSVSAEKGQLDAFFRGQAAEILTTLSFG